jgi:hypothetical protein
MLTAVATGLVACGGAPTERATPATDRSAGIYAAVIRQLLTKDTTFGPGERPFVRAFVVDGIVADAGDPDVTPGSRTPFGEGVREAIAKQLEDLAPVKFVADPQSVIVSAGGLDAHVRDGGVLITLGPISGGGDRVTVSNSLFFAALGAQWLTYVLEQQDGAWHVSGTTGPRAIS